MELSSHPGQATWSEDIKKKIEILKQFSFFNRNKMTKYMNLKFATCCGQLDNEFSTPISLLNPSCYIMLNAGLFGLVQFHYDPFLLTIITWGSKNLSCLVQREEERGHVDFP